MKHREILEKYHREMLEDISFTKYCFEVLVNRLVDRTKCDRKVIKVRIVAYHADCFGLDYVSLIAEVEIKD